MANSSATIYDDDIQCLNLTPTTTLSDVVAVTIHDVSAEDVNDTSGLDQYLGAPERQSAPQSSSPPSQHQFSQSCQYQTTTNNHGQQFNYYTQPCLYQPTAPTMVTPVAKRRPPPLETYYSPMGDSRFNDSLTGLLGSPAPRSPLATNPYFSDLQTLLAKDCKAETNSMPESLLFTMTTQPQPDVFYREQLLQTRFTKLESRFPQDVKQLSNFYRYQAAVVETDRFRSLHQQPYSVDYQRSLNRYFDTQLHQIMERVEKSLTLLEESTPVVMPPVIKPRSQLSKKAIRLMEDWYESHLDHPYPNNIIIDNLATKGNITVDQVKKWFANKRNRSNNTRTLTEIARQKRRRAMQNLF